MALSRRDLLSTIGSAAVAAALPAWDRSAPPGIINAVRPTDRTFPRKQDFAIAEGYTYINGAYTHPMPLVAADALRAELDRRSHLAPMPPRIRPDARIDFAKLINAKPSEIGWIPNTSTGENIVVESLGLNRPFSGNIVTDELHFEGALVHLLELKRRGADVRVVRQRGGRVDLRDYEKLVDKNTKLVSLSWVAMYNGFQHDLKSICELAHAHGAPVYADIVQGVGAVLLDVRATGLDFAATATYKWLMGDFGLGFLFVREEHLGRFPHVHLSYESAPDTDIHLSPFDPLHPTPVTYTVGRDAASFAQLGTRALQVGEALAVSIPYIATLGVENIQAHRIPLLKRLQSELPRLGFTPQTPTDSTSPIVTFAMKDTTAIARKLEAAHVNVRVAPTWVRIAPSVYNDMADVERLLAALSA